jgi:hypothetical protein
LYNLVRRACGDTTTLKDRPCHRFGISEREYALDYLYLFLLFSWDFYVFSYREKDLLFVSHDGHAAYFSPTRIDAIRSRIEAAEIELLEDGRPSILQ